tara:strand:+ start:345 stop:761 length:417 start_codon:yes stop_codon:yes gene_type:complete
MKEVYLYFRTQATLADDDASADSVCFPLSHLQGMVPSADDTLNIYFEPMINQSSIRFDHNGDSTSAVNSDYVVCTIGTNDHKDAISALTKLFSGAANGGIHHDGFIVVADDLAATYAVSEVTALSTISVTAAVATANA